MSVPISPIAAWLVERIDGSAARAPLRVAIEHLLGRTGLKHDDPEAVRDDVMQLPRDAAPLLVGRVDCDEFLFLLERLGLGLERVCPRFASTHAQTHQERQPEQQRVPDRIPEADDLGVVIIAHCDADRGNRQRDWKLGSRAMGGR